MKKITLAAALTCIFSAGLTQVWGAEVGLTIDKSNVLSDAAMEDLRGGVGLNLVDTSGLISNILAAAQSTVSSALMMCGSSPNCNISTNSTTTNPGSLSSLSSNFARAVGGVSQ